MALILEQDFQQFTYVRIVLDHQDRAGAVDAFSSLLPCQPTDVCRAASRARQAVSATSIEKTEPFPGRDRTWI